MFKINKKTYYRLSFILCFVLTGLTLKGMELDQEEEMPLLAPNSSINYNSITVTTLTENLAKFLNDSFLKNNNFVFDNLIKKIANPELRTILIKIAIEWVISIYDNVDIKEIKQFFEKQPEGILKTTIRFIHLRKMGKLIDSKNINFLNQNLISANKTGNLDFTLAFYIGDSYLYALFASLCEIIPHLCKKPITTLRLFGNCLSHLPNEIYYLKNLEEINLSGNDFKKIPEILLNLKKLKKIIVDKKLEKDKNRTKFYIALPNCKIIFK